MGHRGRERASTATIGTARTAALVLAVVAAAAGLGAAPARASGAAGLRWSAPALVDPAPASQVFTSLACPTATFCVATDERGGVATTTDPAAGGRWTVSRIATFDALNATPEIDGLACPSAGECIGTNLLGDVYATRDPAGGPGAWATGTLPSGAVVAGISCPSASLCVVADSASATVYTSIDPTDVHPAAWPASRVPGSNYGLAGVSCPTPTFCALAASRGRILSSSDPAGGGPTYAADQVLPASAGGRAAPDVTAIDCLTATFCVAGDASGDLLTSTDPGTSTATWSVTRIDPGVAFAAITCRASGLCVALDANGTLFASAPAAPGAPGPSPGAGWRRVGEDPDDEPPFQGNSSTFALACPTDTYCLAEDGSPNLPRSSAPAVPGSWQATPPATDAGGAITAISCPSLRLCVAVDVDGNVVTTRTPQRPASWRAALIDPEYELEGVSCPTRSFCVATDTFGNVLVSTDPTGGARAWHAHQIEDGEDGGNGSQTGLLGISCVSAHFCMTGDQNPGDVLTATDPWGPARAWLHHGEDGPGAGLIDASCPTDGFCGVIDAGGNVDAFTPGGGAHFTQITPADGLDAIDCPSRRLCVAVAGGVADNAAGGGAWTSTDPTAAHPRWRHVLGDPAQALAAGCHAGGFCVAVDVAGRALVSLDPTAARARWTSATIDDEAVFTAVACPTRRLCLVADRTGHVRYVRR